MITFIDLAGHHKYLHTTIFGLTSYCPDCALLLVSANTGIGTRGRAGRGRRGCPPSSSLGRLRSGSQRNSPFLPSPHSHMLTRLSCHVPSFSEAAGTTREHLGLALALKVPFFVVVSKVDLCAKTTVERTVRQLERVLKQPGCHKVPMLVTSEDDAVTAAQQFAQSPK